MGSAAIIPMNRRQALCPIHKQLTAAVYVARYVIKPLQRRCFRPTVIVRIAAFVSIETLSWQGETKTFSHRADSGTIMTKHFCPNCGSQLFGTNSTRPDRIHIKVGTMEDAAWFQPQCNVWASSRLPSTPISPDVKDFATMPIARAKK